MSDQFAQQGVDTEYAEGDVQATEADSVDPGRDAVPMAAQADGAASDEAVEVAIDEAADQSTDMTGDEMARVAEQADEDPIAAFKADLRPSR